MIVVETTAVIVTMVVAGGQMMVWDAAMINIGAIVEVLAIDMLADEDTVIFLKFVIITSFSVDVSSDVSVNFFVDVLTDVIDKIQSRAIYQIRGTRGAPVLSWMSKNYQSKRL